MFIRFKSLKGIKLKLVYIILLIFFFYVMVSVLVNYNNSAILILSSSKNTNPVPLTSFCGAQNKPIQQMFTLHINIHWKQTVSRKNTLCVPLQKDSPTGLEEHDGEWLMLHWAWSKRLCAVFQGDGLWASSGGWRSAPASAITSSTPGLVWWWPTWSPS